MSDPMTTAPNNVLVRCWQALWIDGDTHTALGCLHDPYVRHGVDGAATMSPEAYVAHVTTITSHLRGTSLDVDHLHEVGDMLLRPLHDARCQRHDRRHDRDRLDRPLPPRRRQTRRVMDDAPK